MNSNQMAIACGKIIFLTALFGFITAQATQSPSKKAPRPGAWRVIHVTEEIDANSGIIKGEPLVDVRCHTAATLTEPLLSMPHMDDCQSLYVSKNISRFSCKESDNLRSDWILEASQSDFARHNTKTIFYYHKGQFIGGQRTAAEAHWIGGCTGNIKKEVPLKLCCGNYWK